MLLAFDVSSDTLGLSTMVSGGMEGRSGEPRGRHQRRARDVVACPAGWDAVPGGAARTHDHPAALQGTPNSTNSMTMTIPTAPLPAPSLRFATIGAMLLFDEVTFSGCPPPHFTQLTHKSRHVNILHGPSTPCAGTVVVEWGSSNPAGPALRRGEVRATAHRLAS